MNAVVPQQHRIRVSATAQRVIDALAHLDGLLQELSTFDDYACPPGIRKRIQSDMLAYCRVAGRLIGDHSYRKPRSTRLA